MNPAPKSFIETQFPVSKLSKESYRERKAGQGQTLTSLGKWWGRKPLILVRAALIGLLMPASSDPRKDREIFLKILTMDEEGLWRRKCKTIPTGELYAHLTPRERERWFSPEATADDPRLRPGLSPAQKEELQRLVFARLSYGAKLEYCNRPEQVDGPSAQAWAEINAHLGTSAQSLPELVQQLGQRRFGRIPRVGDAFCGGGSVPFEAARLGCEVYASDLSPVAALLTWAGLNIIGGGEEVVQRVRQAQEQVYQAVDQQVTEWGIEHNELGWRADAYLYCNEVVCPECGWKVPLAPSWVIGQKTRCIAKLVPDQENRRFDILIESGVSEAEMRLAQEAGTVKDSHLVCPHCPQNKSTPISLLRGDRRTEEGTEYGLRLWENDDLVPRPDDVFQERLYCIRWVETYIDASGRKRTRRHYRAPDANDLVREQKVLSLLRERFSEWQERGYIPSRRIEPGEETTRLMRERGWTYWHHLFHPRQLLILGQINKQIAQLKGEILPALLLWVGKGCERNARLMGWDSLRETHSHVFTNQALNTSIVIATKTLFGMGSIPFVDASSKVTGQSIIMPLDCRSVDHSCQLWITDPSYADAINYHELSEFFLVWYEKQLSMVFPTWYTDSKRALAITGSGIDFRRSMVACYKNLADHMPDDGMQIVMFTHQDAAVWADLALILWASGLQVTAAWCVRTETSSPLKEGNYVQGTVLLVLRKQTSEQTAFLDELYPQVETEVKAQLDSMLALEDQEDPNFSDTDYQLAAYAAALRVLTQYRRVEDIDVEYELSRTRQPGEKSPLEAMIEDAVKIACDYLVPQGFDSVIWRALTPEERFYLKGLDMESHGEYRTGAYQELARGFGLREYRPLLASTRANQTRLKTASEFGSRLLGDGGFGTSLVRHALFAVRETVRTDSTAAGRNWFRTELKERYWNQRRSLIAILRYLGRLEQITTMPHWKQDAHAARLLAGAVENDHV